MRLLNRRILILAMGCIVAATLSMSCKESKQASSARPMRTARPISDRPYALSPEVPDEERVAAAGGPEEKLQVVRRRWEEVKLAVAYANVCGDTAFYSSLTYWNSGWLRTRKWSHHRQGDMVSPFASDAPAAVLVEGDCLADVTIEGKDGLVHILGDLAARVSVKGHSEVIIAGDVREDGEIVGDGIVRVFVGGDVLGRMVFPGSSKIWINGDCPGRILTGTPMTRLTVMGDFTGDIRPKERGALVAMVVHGFMPDKVIESTKKYGYTQFTATVGVGEREPGMYGDRNAPWSFTIHSGRAQAK